MGYKWEPSHLPKINFKNKTYSDANQQYHDKVTLSNIKVYGYNNQATKITYACSEYLGASASNPWAYSYAPGQAGTGSICNYPASAVQVIN